MIIDDETPTLTAHKITIHYGFTMDGTEWVSVETEEDDEISSVLLLGILDYAKYKVLHPEEEDDEDEVY